MISDSHVLVEAVIWLCFVRGVLSVIWATVVSANNNFASKFFFKVWPMTVGLASIILCSYILLIKVPM